jgi:oligopeptidase A
MDDNPLLAAEGRPLFGKIRAEHVEPAVKRRIEESVALREKLLAKGGPFTWENFVRPLDDAEERLDDAFHPIEHLVHVIHDDAMRGAHRRAKALVTEHVTRRAQDERLWRAFTAVRERADADGLSSERRKILDDELREFRLAGVHLPPAERKRVAEVELELSKISVQFAQNVTDSTDEFRLVVENGEDVAGLPETLVAAAREQALRDDPKAPAKRWSFTLHAPSLMPFLTYQRNRALRERMYRANVTRATSGKHDNGPLIRRKLALRTELAKLLGFANFAEMALVKRMAKSPEEVRAFLLDLARRARPHAERARDELARFAKERDGVEKFERWDVAYYRELLRRERFDFSDEETRVYFPLDRVLGGYRGVVNRLYDVEIHERTGDPAFFTWHRDTRVLEIRETDGRVVGHVFADFFARPGKQSGAWVGGMRARKSLPGGGVQTPAAYLVCNFSPPTGGKPSLLRHEEVRTLFHEFGHALHHVFSRTEERQCSGTRGVPRDGVEFPSQFLENWIWHEEPLALMSGHADTGLPLPAALREKLVASRTFLKAVDVCRQMEFALSDLEIHMSAEPLDERAAHAVFESVRERVGVFRAPDYDRFENGFLHIFAGGYAAGYYGYAWAEVLAADAFGRFEEEGLWSPAAARDFREKVLAKGGAADFMQLFVDYRGRRPTPDALLRSCGLA